MPNKKASFMMEIVYCLCKSTFVKTKFKVELAALTKHTNTKILVGLGYDPSPTISERTMMRWLNAFNIKYSEVQKGIHVDGHDREDVLKYRHEFLEKKRS